MITTQITLTTPGGTAIVLHLGVGNDYRASVVGLEARGQRVATGGLTGTTLHTTRGGVALGEAGAATVRAALAELDAELAVSEADQRAAYDATQAEVDRQIAERTDRAVRTAQIDTNLRTREAAWKAGGWR